MKNIIFYFFVASLFTSCATIDVSSDFDRTAQFDSYKTYKLTNEVQFLPVDDINRNRIITALEETLAKKGFTKSETPDVWIDIKIKTQQKEMTTATTTNYGPGYGYGYGGYYGTGYAYGWGSGFSTTTIDVEQYTEGTMFIDIIDASKKQLVWQGRATKTLDENATEKTRTYNIKRAINFVFAKYPPRY